MGAFNSPIWSSQRKFSPLSSNESQALAADFQEQLAYLHRSPPALGRYFSEAEIYPFRNGSVIAHASEEQQDPAEKPYFEQGNGLQMFRQFLYDQEPDESQPMHIHSVPFNMFLRH